MAKRKAPKTNIIDAYRQQRILESFAVSGACFSSAIPVPDAIMHAIISRYGHKKTSSKRENGTSEKFTYIAYRFYGKPDSTQRHLLSQFTGSARWMWNHLKADSDAFYQETGRKLKRTPAYYKSIPEYAWLNDMDSLALSNAQLNYERARSEWLSGDKGQPKFKKKDVSTESYTTNNVNNNIKLNEHGLKLPRIDTYIRLQIHRSIRPGGRLKSVTVTKEPNGRWYFSILFEYPKDEYDLPAGIEEFMETGDISAIRHIGLDMSLPDMYVDSDGNKPFYVLKDSTVHFMKAYRGLEARIAKEQRKLSHKVKGSANYKRQQKKVAGLHAKAKHQRQDFLQQMSTRLVRNYDVISIEDLDMAGMKKALKFGKSVSDNGWGTFTKLLEEKGLRYGTFIVRTDRWFPSSRKCSYCGYIHKELTLSDRTYVCPVCGNVIDRDKQAAQNIDAEGLRLVIEFLLEGNKYKEAVKAARTASPTAPTAGTAGIGCYNYGVHAKPFSSEKGNMSKMSPVYAAKKKQTA